MNLRNENISNLKGELVARDNSCSINISGGYQDSSIHLEFREIESPVIELLEGFVLEEDVDYPYQHFLVVAEGRYCIDKLVINFGKIQESNGILLIETDLKASLPKNNDWGMKEIRIDLSLNLIVLEQ